MRIKLILFIIAISILSSTLTVTATQADFMPASLTTEYSAAPLAIETPNPRFSWQMKSLTNRRGVSQSAYRIAVTDEDGETIWDTDRITSDQSVNIRYEGEPLLPARSYNWRLYVWNDINQMAVDSARFETGLFTIDDKDPAWGGAKWIGASDEDQPLYSPHLTVFRLDFTITLDKSTSSTRASLVYGANDERLMSRHTNLYHLENKKDESYVAMQLDTEPLDLNGNAIINFYRPGYKPGENPDSAIATFAIPLTKINSSNRYLPHRFIVKSNFGITDVYVDGDSDSDFVGQTVLNPLGRGGDFIAFPALAEVGYQLDNNQIATFSDVQIRHYRQPSNVIRSISINAKPGRMEVSDPSHNSIPLLRTEFHIPAGKKITKARLYATARGIYDFWINGKMVSNQWYNPGLTQYNKEHLYQVFDVTDLVKNGGNALGAIIAEGWWSGEISMTGELWNYFGDQQSLLAKLLITFDDGTSHQVVTSPSTWSVYNKGPEITASMFNGIVYDGRLETPIEGWTSSGFESSGWKSATEIDIETTKTTHHQPGWEPADDYSTYRLKAHSGQPVTNLMELTAHSVKEVKPGIWVYDMGQNMAGVPSLTLHDMAPGTPVHIHYAEMTYPSSPLYGEDSGMIMYENYRAAMSHDTYICRGGDTETFTPRHTLHGFRFIEITGIDRPLPINDVKGIVVTSIDKITADYNCSNEKVNRLWQNILWSSYANFISIPTDCPQRNERLGWSGDISVFSPTATHLARIPNFLRRHLSQMRNCQSDRGRFPDIAPLSGGFGGFLWGSAGITVTWELWKQYADIDMLAEHYEAMAKYINYVDTIYFDHDTGIMVQEPNWNLGDWLGLEDNRNDRSILWDAYWIYDLEIMAKMAAILGHDNDASHYREKAKHHRDIFSATYIDKETGLTLAGGIVDRTKGDIVDTQTSYVLPLAFDVLDDELASKSFSRLVESIERRNKTDQGIDCEPFSLMTGFIGTAFINKVLSAHKRSDIAYRLLQQTSYPSWLYPVEQGATTIWERLNSYTHDAGFGGNNRMNSFNHYSFGAIGSWLLANSLGISCDGLNTAAYKHFTLKPEIDPTGMMKFARGHYESLHGLILSNWERDDTGNVSYKCTVPANTTALLTLPAPSKSINESGVPLNQAKGIHNIVDTDETTTMTLVSGSFFFTISNF